VTREDIQRYVAQYIIGKNYVAGMIINPEMNKQFDASGSFKPSL
jgi:zinc protease